MTEQGLAVRDNNLFIAPVVNVQGALQRYQDMKDFIQSILKNEVDYGIIPGTSKPTLLKPGAEKLSTFFGLSTQFAIIEKSEDWTGENHGGESFFNYWYKCTLTRNGKVIAEGEGSCNSFEKKYRYRSADIKCPKCGSDTIKKSKFDDGWYCFGKIGGCNAKFSKGDKSIEDQPRGQIKNPDIADIVNTLQKMGQKRAYIAAVLLATNASEYFTQDIEDYIDAEFVPVEPDKKQPAKAKQTVQQTPPPVEWFDEPESMVDAAVELGGQVKSSMSLEMAISEVNSDGVKYGDLPTDKLSVMANALQKKLKSPMGDIEREDRERKLDACKVILESRQ